MLDRLVSSHPNFTSEPHLKSGYVFGPYLFMLKVPPYDNNDRKIVIKGFAQGPKPFGYVILEFCFLFWPETGRPAWSAKKLWTRPGANLINILQP